MVEPEWRSEVPTFAYLFNNGTDDDEERSFCKLSALRGYATRPKTAMPYLNQPLFEGCRTRDPLIFVYFLVTLPLRQSCYPK
jgi:hypothetical protein